MKNHNSWICKRRTRDNQDDRPAAKPSIRNNLHKATRIGHFWSSNCV